MTRNRPGGAQDRPENLPAITIARSDSIRIGDVALAIGNPFGVGQTVTMGIISATGRNQLGLNTYEDFIQTDAAINPGNSGGALVDASGNLIGINTAIFSKSGGSQGIGFAIPTKLAMDVMKSIIEHGQVIRGWLGIEVQPLTQELAESFGLKDRPYRRGGHLPRRTGAESRAATGRRDPEHQWRTCRRRSSLDEPWRAPNPRTRLLST